MLANTYDADVVELAEYWISEKYDGIRAWWNGSELLSRTGGKIQAPRWFTEGWPSQPLDGELWVGRGQFETVSGIVRREQPDDESWRRVRFMVFDLPMSPGTFDFRIEALRQVVAALGAPWVQVVEQFRLRDEHELTTTLAETVSNGGEGLMLHRANSRYAAIRSNDLLKLKPYDDAEAQVVGYLPGKGKYTGWVGALRVRTASGLEFNLGSGLSDEQRRQPPRLGSWITYGYHGFTARGIPRFARLVKSHVSDGADR
jgi:DNA ligase 1